MNTNISLLLKSCIVKYQPAGLHLTETATTWHSILLFFFLMKNWVLGFSLAEFPGAGYFSFITNLAHFNLILSPWYMSLSLQGKFIWVQFSPLKLIGCLPHYPDWSVDCLLFIFLITKKLICRGKIKGDTMFSTVRDDVLTETCVCLLLFISGWHYFI